MAEVMVAADSTLAGKTVVDAGFRTRFGLTAIACGMAGCLTRACSGGGAPDRRHLARVGPWKDIERLRADPGELLILNLPTELAEVLSGLRAGAPRPACLVLMVGLMVSGIVPTLQAA